MRRGFTLIELLVVIVILGILAAVVVFAVGGITNKGTKSACQIEVRTVNTALQAYFAQNTAYPGTAATTVTQMFGLLQTAGFLTTGAPGASATTPAPVYTFAGGTYTASC